MHYVFQRLTILILLLVSGAAAKAAPSVRTIGIAFVPHESNTIDWARDVGISRSEITACKADNESAEWYELCTRVMADKESSFSFVIEENTSSTPAPNSARQADGARVLLETVRGAVALELRAIVPVSFISGQGNISGGKTSSAPVIAITTNFQKHLLTCALTTPELQKKTVRKNWILSNRQRDRANQLILEHEELSFSSLKGFDYAECQIVAFDGLLFKRFSALQELSSLDLLPTRTSRMVLLSSADFWNQDLSTWLGIRAENETYHCTQLNEDPFIPNLCNMFNSSTGVPERTFENERLLKTAPAQSATTFNLKISKSRTDQAPVEIPLQIVLNNQTPSDSSELYTHAPVVLNSKSPFQAIACDPENDASHGMSRLHWSINGRELKSWSGPWLPAHFLTFGNRYGCTAGSAPPQNLAYDDKFARIIGPAETTLDARQSRIVLNFEVNLPLPGLKTKWSCATASPSVQCKIFGPEDSSSGLVEFSETTPLTTRSQATISVAIVDGSEVHELAKTALTINPAGMSRQIGDASGLVHLEQHGTTDFSCWFASEKHQPGESYSVFWYLDGKEMRSRRDRHLIAWLPEMYRHLLTCKIISHPDAAPSVGIASLVVAPPVPDFSKIPETMVVDLEHPTHLEYSYSTALPARYRIACNIVSAGGQAMTDNLCLHSKHEGRQRPEGIERHFFELKIPEKELGRIFQLLSLNSQDPYFLSGYELHLVLSDESSVFSKVIPVQLIRPTIRPVIQAAFSYFEKAGGSTCVFLLSDRQNNHLTAKVVLEERTEGEELFSTFDRMGAKKLIRLNPGSGGVQTWMGVARFAAAPSPNRVHPELQGSPPKCRILASNGTLIVTMTTTQLTDDLEARKEIERTVAASRPSARLDTPPAILPAAQSGAAPEVESFPSPRFLVRNVNIEHAGEIKITQPDVETKILTIVECSGLKENCRQFKIKNESLQLTATADFAPEITHLTLLDSRRHLIFLVLDIQSEIFSPLKFQPSSGCLSYIMAKSEGRLPEWNELTLVARFGGAQNDVAIPLQRVGMAMMSGATDILCQIKAVDARRVAVNTRILSLKADPEFASQMASMALPESISINQPADRLLNALDLLARESLRSALGSESLVLLPFATQFKIEKCEELIANESNSCRFNAENLMISLRRNSQKQELMNLGISFVLLGQIFHKDIAIRIYDSGKVAEAQFFGVRLVPKDKDFSRFSCMVSTLDESDQNGPFAFQIFANEKLISASTSTTPEYEIQIPPGSGDDTLLCIVGSPHHLEVASFRKIHEGEKLDSLCWSVTKQAQIVPFKCEVSFEFATQATPLQARAAEIVPPDVLANSVAVRFSDSIENSVKLSATFPILPGTAAAEPPDPDLTTFSAAFVDPFSGRSICINGIAHDEQAQIEPITQKSGRSMLCPMLGFAPLLRSKATDFREVYSDVPTSNANGSTGMDRYYKPDAEILFLPIGPHAPDIEKWVNQIARINQLGFFARYEISCTPSEVTEVEEECQQLADRVVERTASRQIGRIRFLQNAEMKEKNPAYSRLVLRALNSDGSREYDLTLAEINPEIQETMQ